MYLCMENGQKRVYLDFLSLGLTKIFQHNIEITYFVSLKNSLADPIMPKGENLCTCAWRKDRKERHLEPFQLVFVFRIGQNIQA